MSPKCPDAPTATDALTLTTETIEPGTSLYRFHGYDPTTGRYSGDAFNPYASPGFDWTVPADGARFSPFPLSGEASGYVPGIYAAADHQSAVFESLFHDLEHRPGVDMYWDDLVRRGWHFTRLEVVHSIVVTPIATPNLRRLEVPHGSTSLTVAELVHSQRDSYPQTRAWASRHDPGSDRRCRTSFSECPRLPCSMVVPTR